jgi:hypothetical protein
MKIVIMPRHTDSLGARDVPDEAGDGDDSDEGTVSVSCRLGDG